MKEALKALAALLTAGVCLGSCGYANRHDDQSTPPVTRLVTIPAGATCTVVSRNQEWITPFDFTQAIDLDEEIVVSKEGYRTFRGTLEELPQIALGTYQLELEPQR